MAPTPLDRHTTTETMALWLQKRFPPPAIRNKLDIGWRLEAQSLLLFETRQSHPRPALRSVEDLLAPAIHDMARLYTVQVRPHSGPFGLVRDFGIEHQDLHKHFGAFVVVPIMHIVEQAHTPMGFESLNTKSSPNYLAT